MGQLSTRSFSLYESEKIKYLQGKCMPIPNISCEFNDSLHPLNLSFDSLIEVFLLNLREQQEVDRPRIRLVRIFRDERSERLIDVLSQEGGVR